LGGFNDYLDEFLDFLSILTGLVGTNSCLRGFIGHLGRIIFTYRTGYRYTPFTSGKNSRVHGHPFLEGFKHLLLTQVYREI